MTASAVEDDPSLRVGPRIGVSAPIYDSPGGVVPAIVTVYGVPDGYQVAISSRGTDQARSTCVGTVWRNPIRDTASRKCYLWLLRTRGTYNVIGTAVLTRDGSPVLRVSGRGARPVQANGIVCRVGTSRFERSKP